MVRLNEGLERAATKKPVYYEERPIDEDGSDASAASELPSEPIRKKSKPNPTEVSDDPVPQASSRQSRQTQAATTQPQSQAAPSRRMRIGRMIDQLEKAGKGTLTYCDSKPLKSESKLQPPACNLGLLKLSTANLPWLDELTLYGWLTSNDVLPCIKQWKQECLDNYDICASLQTALPSGDFPFDETTKYLSRTAPRYATIVNQRAGL